MFSLINLKNFYYSKLVYQIAWPIIGLLICVGLVFFPINPGPTVIGDLLPIINIMILVLFFVRRIGSDNKAVDYNNEKRNALGFISLGVALIHFLFPGLVII